MRLGIKIKPAVKDASSLLPLADNIELRDVDTGELLEGVAKLTLNVEPDKLVTADIEVFPNFVDVEAALGLVMLRTHEEIPSAHWRKLLEDSLPSASKDLINSMIILLGLLSDKGVVLAERNERRKD